jgi:hypothetical protein
MNISNSPILGERTLLRRQPGGDFVPDLPEPTSPEEAKLFKETKQRAEQADKFLDHHSDLFVKFREKDNTEEDLNSAPGLVATSERLLESPLDRAITSTVLKFDPLTKDVKSYQNQANGLVSRKAGNSWTEMLEQTASTSFTSSPFSMSAEQLWVVADDSSRSARYQESLRAVGEGLYEYLTFDSDALAPKD